MFCGRVSVRLPRCKNRSFGTDVRTCRLDGFWTNCDPTMEGDHAASVTLALARGERRASRSASARAGVEVILGSRSTYTASMRLASIPIVLRLPTLSVAALRGLHVSSEAVFGPLVELTAARFAPALSVPHDFLVQLLTIEDKRFFLHPGLDPISVVRAGLSNTVGEGFFQGASTITQQLYDAHQDLAGITRERTLSRKSRQATWALVKEWQAPKLEILSDYLRIVYWGLGCYGLDAAAAGYFRSEREGLTVAQGFFLAERVASPNVVSVERVVCLLRRPSIWALLRRDEPALSEIVSIYEKRFRCGGELCECLEKYRKRSDAPTRPY